MTDTQRQEAQEIRAIIRKAKGRIKTAQKGIGRRAIKIRIDEALIRSQEMKLKTLQ
jgi:hypothetical protein